MSETKRNTINYLRLAFYLIPILIFFWLLNKNFALTGQASYTYSPGKYRSDQIISLNQPDLIKGVYESDGKVHWLAGDDNLKFTAKILRHFEKVKVKMTLNNISQPMIYFLAQATVNKVTRQDLVSAPFLDGLTWPLIGNSQFTLWQRPGVGTSGAISNGTGVRQYKTIDEFLSDPPSAAKIGVFGLPAEQFYQIPNYQNDQSQRSIDHYFRGSHTLYFYKEGEPFNFSLKKIDLNRQAGGDGLNVSLYLGTQLVHFQALGDDGDISASNKNGPAQELKINLPDLPKGFYHLVFDTTDDVIFGELKTQLKYLFFNGLVFLADGPAYQPGGSFRELTLMTDSKSLSFSVPHAVSLDQNLKYTLVPGGALKSMTIDSVKNNYQVSGLAGINNLIIAKPDIYLSGDNFSFPFFTLPANIIKTMADQLVVENIDSLDYILAPYQPKASAGPLTFIKEYKMDDLFLKDQKIYFNLSSPGLTAFKTGVEIKSISLQLSGSSLTPAKIWEKAKSFLKKIFK